MTGDEIVRASSHPEPDASGIDITSGVSSRTGHGFVGLRWGDRSVQLTSSEAISHASAILVAAAAADHDAVVYRWLRHQMHMDDGQAAMVLFDLRRHRAHYEAEIGADRP